jgi:transcriptional regulator with XRE-family HTH domain
MQNLHGHCGEHLMQNKNRTRLLAIRLRQARREAGLSQTEIAARLNRPQSYISRCESGARRIDVFELQEFARVYDKPLTFFVENLPVALRGK